jgi:glycosyltransferase involved in cell wall biosynthesis
MKLLYFTIQINMVGGLARIVIDKMNWLVAHGYEVSLCNIESLEIHPAYPIDPRVKLLRGDIQTTPGGIATRIKGVLGAIRRTQEIVRIVQPDIIVNAHCPLVTWILPFVHKDIPKIVEMHQSRQGLDVFDRQFMSPLARLIHRFSTKWFYGRYDCFVVLTNGDKDAWHCKNCMVVPNFHHFTVRESLPKKHESKQIILLARLMPQKRIDLMIDAWALLAKDYPDWHVKVLGEGLQRPQLETKIHELHLQESFLLPGEVKDVTNELQQSDILCLTSEYEGFGIVLIEAMANGIPVIAFEYVGVHDIIDNGTDGVIVPFGDVQTYSEQLRKLMTDSELRQRFAGEALHSVHKFDKEKVMARWDELFNSLRVHG